MGLVQIHDRKDTIYKSMNPVFHKVLMDSANAISSSGKIKEVEYCGWYIRRCVLEDNVVLRFPGYLKKSYPRNLKVGTTIEYTGVEQHLKSGEVMERDYKIIHCISVLVNGTEYIQCRGGWHIESEYGMY